jgi:hypothetical protein
MQNVDVSARSRACGYFDIFVRLTDLVDFKWSKKNEAVRIDRKRGCDSQ